MKYLLVFFICLPAFSSVFNCKTFELTMQLSSFHRNYFLKTMKADIQIKKRKAYLTWDSGHESKKWKISNEEGLIEIESKDLKKVFESYEDSTSSARYVQLMNFIEDYEDEDDFRFTPLNEAAPFVGDSSYPCSIGEYLVQYKYSDCK